VDFTDLAGARKRCRNPKCRLKLPEPVVNEREAFCTRGCHGSFYLHRCVVCEERIERSTTNQKICKKGECRRSVERTPKTPIKSGPKSAIADDRPPAFWRVVGAGVPISANAYHCATIGAVAAIADADRTNESHWKAARAGERGYRHPDRRPRVPVTSMSPATPTDRSDLAIPDDLSIPAFLDRRST
jgi:hypothetical protein